MALRTATKPGVAGAVVAFGAVATSDTFLNNGSMVLRVVNGSGASINVTIKDRGSTAPAAASAFNGDVVVAVAAGAEKSIGPFLPSRFNDSTGICTVEYSATATVTSALVDGSY